MKSKTLMYADAMPRQSYQTELALDIADLLLKNDQAFARRAEELRRRRHLIKQRVNNCAAQFRLDVVSERRISGRPGLCVGTYVRLRRYLRSLWSLRPYVRSHW